MRLIDADELYGITELMNTDMVQENKLANFILEQVLFDIQNAPTVNAKEEIYAKWIRVDDTKCKCSNCDVITLIAQYPRGNKDYCPNCGAKMDKE